MTNRPKEPFQRHLAATGGGWSGGCATYGDWYIYFSEEQQHWYAYDKVKYAAGLINWGDRIWSYSFDGICEKIEKIEGWTQDE